MRRRAMRDPFPPWRFGPKGAAKHNAVFPYPLGIKKNELMF